MSMSSMFFRQCFRKCSIVSAWWQVSQRPLACFFQVKQILIQVAFTKSHSSNHCFFRSNIIRVFRFVGYTSFDFEIFSPGNPVFPILFAIYSLYKCQLECIFLWVPKELQYPGWCFDRFSFAREISYVITFDVDMAWKPNKCDIFVIFE